MANVLLSEITKIYADGTRALDHVNLAVRSGEFVVLVGPSGCGKSTLLRSIAGLERIESGTIEIGERRVNDVHPAERQIGMVFQDYALYPHMNVRENLSFGLKLRKMAESEIRKRIQETAAMLGLDSLLTRKPSELSGGQRQRVAIGRALVKHPQVLLLDEPLSNLDAQLRAQTRVELAALHRRIGSTTIYVTHDQEEAMTLADRIAVLRAGKLQQFAPPMELYHHPVNRFVGSFIGNPSMNFLSGQIESGLFVTEGQRIPLGHGSLPDSATGRIILGIRPEDLRFSDTGLSAQLTWIELHGHEVHIIANLGQTRLTARLADPRVIERMRTLTPGARIHFTLNPEHLHWFDPDSGDSLRRLAPRRSVA